MSQTQKIVGARLKQLREEAQIRVEDVARLADVNRTHIYAVERGDWWPSMDLIETLARIYRVEIADCFVFPEKHVRHRFRELARLAPNAKLAAIINASEEILGKSLDEMIVEAMPPTEVQAPAAPRRKVR
jgi:DNA-binding XRE family transcriptional regulator